MISRRQLLYFSALFSFCYPIINFKHFLMADERNDNLYPLTIEILKEAYLAEITANMHYDEYCQKALSENYQNIAYLFSALSNSEKIHAINYKNLMASLEVAVESMEVPVFSADTKKNLNNAAKNELEKINQFYPRIYDQLLSESHEKAILYCMYSWKSHKQHEIMIRDIQSYSGIFFGPLARKIENMNPNYHVCEICGSTVDEMPTLPCEICTHTTFYYKKLKRPILSAMK
ncbi:MAG: hypothetical protein M0T82_12590 [Desulfobacteraceae bacterium]|nr:hypothetical protein [Desulfobacteraceae bacterium]